MVEVRGNWRRIVQLEPAAAPPAAPAPADGDASSSSGMSHAGLALDDELLLQGLVEAAAPKSAARLARESVASIVRLLLEAKRPMGIQEVMQANTGCSKGFLNGLGTASRSQQITAYGCDLLRLPPPSCGMQVVALRLNWRATAEEAVKAAAAAEAAKAAPAAEARVNWAKWETQAKAKQAEALASRRTPSAKAAAVAPAAAAGPVPSGHSRSHVNLKHAGRAGTPAGTAVAQPHPPSAKCRAAGSSRSQQEAQGPPPPRPPVQQMASVPVAVQRSAAPDDRLGRAAAAALAAVADEQDRSLLQAYLDASAWDYDTMLVRAREVAIVASMLAEQSQSTDAEGLLDPRHRHSLQDERLLRVVQKARSFVHFCNLLELPGEHGRHYCRSRSGLLLALAPNWRLRAARRQGGQALPDVEVRALLDDYVAAAGQDEGGQRAVAVACLVRLAWPGRLGAKRPAKWRLRSSCIAFPADGIIRR